MSNGGYGWQEPVLIQKQLSSPLDALVAKAMSYTSVGTYQLQETNQAEC